MSEEDKPMSERVFEYTGWAAAMSKAVGPAWSFGLYRAIRKVMHKRRHEVIVRCKDCKHYSEHEWIIATDVSDVCHFWHGEPTKVEPDGFCKWGEPREVCG